MNKPVLIIHNGNRTVKKLIAEKLNLDTSNTIASIATLEDKIKFLKSNRNVVTDLTSADVISYIDLFKLKKHCKIIKILSPYQYDLENLEGMHDKNSFTQLQWMKSLSSRLWAADQIIKVDQFETFNSKKLDHNICFTIGRTGSHILLSVVNLTENELLHPTNELLSDNDRLQRLICANKIFSVYRNDLYHLVASKILADQLGFFMITTKENYQKNVEIAQSIKPFLVTEENVIKILGHFLNFIDLVLLLKVYYNKDIHVTNLESLKRHSKNLETLKNPYNLDSMIINKLEIEKIINSKFQKIYQYSVDTLIKHCGLSIL